MSLYRLETDVKSCVPRTNGINAVLAWANSAAEAKALAKGGAAGDTDSVWDNATTSLVINSPNLNPSNHGIADFSGWTMQVDVWANGDDPDTDAPISTGNYLGIANDGLVELAQGVAVDLTGNVATDGAECLTDGTQATLYVASGDFSWDNNNIVRVTQHNGAATDPLAIFFDITITGITSASNTNNDFDGYQFELAVFDSGDDPMMDPAVFTATVTGSPGDSTDAILTTLAAEILAQGGMLADESSYSNGYLVIAPGDKNAGDKQIVLTITPPDGNNIGTATVRVTLTPPANFTDRFPSNYTFNPNLLITSIYDGAAENGSHNAGHAEYPLLVVMNPAYIIPTLIQQYKQ